MSNHTDAHIVACPEPSAVGADRRVPLDKLRGSNAVVCYDRGTCVSLFNIVELVAVTDHARACWLRCLHAIAVCWCRPFCGGDSRRCTSSAPTCRGFNTIRQSGQVVATVSSD